MLRFFAKIAALAGLLALLIAVLSLSSSGEIYRSAKDEVVSLVEPPAVLIFTGDLMLARGVRGLMDRNGENYPFQKIKDFLSEAPVVANLEGPVMEKSSGYSADKMKFSFASSSASLLLENNIKIVSLANNHLFDFGRAGFLETENILDETGVAYFGHPLEQGQDYVLDKKIGGRNFTFISFNATYPSFSEEKALLLIGENKRADNFLCVVIHWGEEYEKTSNDFQKKLAREILDSGADVVVGSHPHVVQEIEKYKGKMIFYSLGNFIFDQYFSQDVQEGLSVKLSLDESKVTYELFPTKSAKSQPELLSDNEKKKWLQDFAERNRGVSKDEVVSGEISLPLDSGVESF